ncbi:hypothetical protein MCOR25_002735 [Pyricularia grisea]|nr:hypothetical protein MCOR25_002735 [Pyricularia grisea]
MAAPKTMKAVVFDGPYKISVQDRPVPQLQNDKDIIVKVHASGLCGSELHAYRGIEEFGSGFIMGHEFTGTVTEVGSAVKTVQVGDKVVTPFTVSCMECFYCKKTQTSRCEHSQLFGSAALDGGQAEYVRVPFADGTVVKAPDEFAEDDKALVLMADIWPTGYFGASNAFKLLEATPDPVVVVIGCGPVGLCAVVAALEHKPKHLFAIDGVDSRLELAKGLGAEPLNFVTDREGMFKRIMEVSGGRGADAVVEVVGLKDALRTAFDILRPFGVISSIGVHSTELPWTAAEAYDKNVRVQMGRCPVRGVFEEALELLVKRKDKFSFMFDKILPLDAAVEAYDMFDKRKVQKVIFTP